MYSRACFTLVLTTSLPLDTSLRVKFLSCPHKNNGHPTAKIELLPCSTGSCIAGYFPLLKHSDTKSIARLWTSANTIGSPDCSSLNIRGRNFLNDFLAARSFFSCLTIREINSPRCCVFNELLIFHVFDVGYSDTA